MADGTGIKRVSVLGSTGSVGTQTLSVIARNPAAFRASALCCGTDTELLARQVRVFAPDTALSGADALDAPELYDADIAVIAVGGIAGLRALENAVKYRVPRVALANKEAVVAGGEYILPAAARAGVEIIPVDSEHSAIFQILHGAGRGSTDGVKRVILTASGGPFRTFTRGQLARVTVAEALRHPTFKMGKKISVDSATMMNKGLEVIEAHRLFGLPPERIECVIHPESVIHSMAEFIDGSHMAHMGYPDMELPITFALTYPRRVPTAVAERRLDFAAQAALHFEALDTERFPCFTLAQSALRAGGIMPCALSAANETAVDLFLRGAIGFTRIYDIIDGVLNTITNGPADTYGAVTEADGGARTIAAAIGKRLSGREG
jgi:1-deoxy-D-xylulose-5-phosphate reductoisomerase